MTSHFPMGMEGLTYPRYKGNTLIAENLVLVMVDNDY